MYEKNKRFNDLMDLTAIRIITEKKLIVTLCGSIAHSIFEPIEGNSKTISLFQKKNGYPISLSTVKGMDKQIVKFKAKEQNKCMK